MNSEGPFRTNPFHGSVMLHPPSRTLPGAGRCERGLPVAGQPRPRRGLRGLAVPGSPGTRTLFPTRVPSAALPAPGLVLCRAWLRSQASPGASPPLRGSAGRSPWQLQPPLPASPALTPPLSGSPAQQRPRACATPARGAERARRPPPQRRASPVAQAQRCARAKMAAGSSARWLGVAAAAGRSRGRDGRLPLVWLVRGLSVPPPAVAASARAARRLLPLRTGLCAAGERGRGRRRGLSGPGRGAASRGRSRQGRAGAGPLPAALSRLLPSAALTRPSPRPLCPPLPQARSALPPPPSTAAPRAAPRRTITRCWGCPAPPPRRRSRRPITRHVRAGTRALPGGTHLLPGQAGKHRACVLAEEP